MNTFSEESKNRYINSGPTIKLYDEEFKQYHNIIIIYMHLSKYNIIYIFYLSCCWGWNVLFLCVFEDNPTTSATCGLIEFQTRPLIDVIRSAIPSPESSFVPRIIVVVPGGQTLHRRAPVSFWYKPEFQDQQRWCFTVFCHVCARAQFQICWLKHSWSLFAWC